MNFEKFTDRSRDFVLSAQSWCIREGHQQVTPEHLLKILLDDPEGLTAGLISRAGGQPEAVLSRTEQMLHRLPKVSGSGTGQIYIASALAKVFDQAEKIVEKAGDGYVTVERLLLALAMEKEAETSRILAESGVTPVGLNAAMSEIRKGRTADSASDQHAYDALKRYARDLTEEASKGKLDPIIGRDQEIRRAMEVLSRRVNNNPILIGEAGVGKTAIVHGLAQRIVDRDVPGILEEKRLLVLDMGALVTGTKYRGESDERLGAIFKQISAEKNQFILMIDNLHDVVCGNEGTFDTLTIIKSALTYGDMQIISSTTPDGYKKLLSQGIVGQFQPVFVSEATADDTIAILRRVKERYELHHGVRITDSALVAAIRFSQEARYLSHRFLPSKAIDLVDEAAARLSMRIGSRPEEMDDLDRRVLRLKIEREALKRENDSASKDRLNHLRQEITQLDDKLYLMESSWREKHAKIQKLKEELDKRRIELEMAQRRGDLSRAGELVYSVIPELERNLRAIKSADDGVILQEAVTPDQIAAVVSRWIGIPVEEILAEKSKTNGKLSVSTVKIFISYRQKDSAGAAGRLHDRLEREFGRDLIFMDVSSIQPGSDFVKELDDQVRKCEVLLAVIGPKWLDIRDSKGNRRIDDPNDFVRLEIRAALHRNIRVIPVLIEGAEIPRPDQLPQDLQNLSRRQGLEIRHEAFSSDTEILIKILTNT